MLDKSPENEIAVMADLSNLWDKNTVERIQQMSPNDKHKVFATLNEVKKRIDTIQKSMKPDLKGYAIAEGEVVNGHAVMHSDTGAKITVQRRSKFVYDADALATIAKARDIPLDEMFDMKTSESKLEQLVAQGRITVAEIEGLTNISVTEALVIETPDQVKKIVKRLGEGL